MATLSTVSAQSILISCVITADTCLTDNRMTAIMILFSYANISDCTPRLRGVYLDIAKQK